MSPLPRPKPSPGVLVRALVSLGAVWAVAAALAAYVAGRAVPGPGFGAEFATLVVIGALARRYGVALPGNGFSSYILGVTAFAVLDRGWACAVLVGPTAMVAGDLMLRRLPPRAALVNAAPPPAGTAVVGLMYDRLGGAAGPDTFDPPNPGPLGSRRSDRAQALGHSARGGGRRARPDPRAVAGHRPGHLAREELRAHPGAPPPAGAVGADGVCAV